VHREAGLRRVGSLLIDERLADRRSKRKVLDVRREALRRVLEADVPFVADDFRYLVGAGEGRILLSARQSMLRVERRSAHHPA
jgi:hypothetical protein